MQFLQKQEASSSCVSDRTAPVCVCILAPSSQDLEEQQRILTNCRHQLVQSNIRSGQELLHQLNSSEAFLTEEQLLQSFFRLSLHDGSVLSTRLKCTTSSGMMTLPSIVNVFFEQSSKTPFDGQPDDGSDSATGVQDDDEELEDDGLIRRSQSNDPILLKNQTTVSAFNSRASRGGRAIQSLPVCDIASASDEVGSYHVEVVPFAREEHEGGNRSVEPFGGIKDGDDGDNDDDDASR